MTIWINIVIGIFCILTGLAVHVLKWYFLIAGYNTMPKEKKKKVDTKGLGRLMGIYFYVNGALFILMGVLQIYDFHINPIWMYVFLGISTIYLLIQSQKYDGNIYDDHGTLKKGLWKRYIVLSVVIIIFVFVGTLMILSSQSTKVTFIEEGIQIHGMYGEVYTYDSIDTVKLMEELPTIEMRTNGSAIGSNLKGYFKTKELGKVKLFVNTTNPPFIYLETDGKITIFNLNNSNETEEVFQKITKQIE